MERHAGGLARRTLELVLDMDQQTEGSPVGPAEVLKAAGFEVKPLCKSPFISSGTNLYAGKLRAIGQWYWRTIGPQVAQETGKA